MNERKQRIEELFLAALELDLPGQRASYLDRECADEPSLREEVEELLRASEAAETVFEPYERARAAARVSSEKPISERPGSVIGHYKLLQLIGEGGMGAVYMAEQLKPVHRRVAFKIIKLGMDTRQVVARFEAERQALALMDHPNIAKVLDGGATDTGRPYFVMELVQGIPITRFCEQTQLSARERLQLFVAVCHAIQHAHQKGIIHRDLKPTNVLVTLNDGVPHPMVIDFGVAKATNQRLTEKTLFTNFATMIGTPAYMSPEQAEMSKLDVDTRSDIYSLGVLLYELLTGTTPFPEQRLRSAGYAEMQRIIMEETPERPSTRFKKTASTPKTGAATHSALRPPLSAIPSDLDWIVMKCLEKDRNRRYETANGLAADLQRHLEDHPVLARPPSRLYEFQKSVRRHWVGFAATAAVLTALLAGLGFSTWMLLRERSAHQRAVAAELEQSRLRIEEQRAREQAETQVYLSDVNLAQDALRDSNFLRAQRLLERDIPSPGHPDRRNWEWSYLWDAVKSDELATLGHQAARITGVGFSSDGSVAGACDLGGVVKLWDVITCSNIATFHYDGKLYGLAFQPAGDLVAAAGSHSVALWNWRTRSAMGELPHPPGVRRVCFFPNGRRLAVLCDDTRLLIWDSQTRKVTHTFTTTIDREPILNGGLAVSPDGKTIAAAGVAGPITLFSASGAGPIQIIHHQVNLTSLAFAPNTNQLLVAGWDKGLWVYELDHLRLLTNVFAHQSWVCQVAFSPSGDLAVSSGADQLIRFWSTRDWRPIGVLKGNHEELGPVAFSPDGKYLVSGAKDGEVKLWDAEAEWSDRHHVQIPPGVALLADSPNGLYVTTRTRGNQFQVRSATNMAVMNEFTPLSANPRCMRVSPDGQLCATLDPNASKVRLYATSMGHVVTNLVGDWKEVRAVEFSGDGASLLVVEGTTNCELWSTAAWTRRLKVAVPVPGDARLRLSPHARWLAVLADGSAAVWRLSRPPASFPITGHKEEVWDVAFSPDGTCLASVGEGGYACIQRLGEKKHFQRFRTGLLSAVALAYSPDGSRLVTANSDSSLRVWETGAYEQVLSIIPSVFRVARRVWFVDSNTLLELGILDYNPNKPFFRKYYAPPLLTGQTPNSIRQ